MSERIDPKTLKAQIIHLNGAASMLQAVDMALVPMTDETIQTLIWTLRDVSDWLEKQKGGTDHGSL